MSNLDQRLAYGVSDAARLIGISRSKMYTLIAADKIPARKLGGRTLILHSDLLILLGNAPHVTLG
ncbi:helix-turn-helix domain-containing protein [Methylobacterium pseudosasicola]|uniref:helix-turn-helix domain-containing protein n=1 Tax=Methylobacterium pseudosasicola TaxID=582667 RepID=UPI00244E7567|nr:helix-turn-helix domain-containing protein [Methylobacterium pseudosasicola]